MRWLCMEEHAGCVDIYMMMMMYVDVPCWNMLDLGENEVMLKYMKCNHSIYDKSMIYSWYHLMNMSLRLWTPAVHFGITMI